MLVTEQFVFVHVPKTGGSFVRTLIRTHMRVVAEYTDHASYDKLPPEFADLPVLRVVRNPWDWYVSHYHYAQVQGKPGLAGELFFGPDRRAPFPEFIAAVCGTPELPSSVWPGPRWIRAMKELECDFYTALDHVMVGGHPRTWRPAGSSTCARTCLRSSGGTRSRSRRPFGRPYWPAPSSILRTARRTADRILRTTTRSCGTWSVPAARWSPGTATSSRATRATRQLATDP